MSAIKELTVYKMLRLVADRMDDDSISHMLERVSNIVDDIKTTHLYKQVLKKLRDNEFPMLENVATMLADLQNDHPQIDSSAIFWLIGLRCASTIDEKEHDPEHAIQMQVMLFLASQSDNFYRISDDRMRLLVTYTYLQTASSILFKDDNSN